MEPEGRRSPAHPEGWRVKALQLTQKSEVEPEGIGSLVEP